MKLEDEKDLQQILFLVARILERQHLSDESAPAAPKLIPFPVNLSREKTQTTPHDKMGVVLQFPTTFRAAAVEETEQGAAESQKEIEPIFSDEEISKMPRKFRKIFRTNKQTAHVRKKDGDVYEIRMQIDGHRITASAKYLDLAKERFIKKLKEYNEHGALTPQAKKRVFLLPYMSQWLETVKKPFIKENTYKMYLQTFNAYIVPNFENRTIPSLTQFELQSFINSFVTAGKNRTAQKVALLLSAVLDYATDDGIIERSPMKRVIVARYEQESGQSLTREEEKTLISSFLNSSNIYAQAYVFMLYTGIRRGELASVQLSDGWITVITGKQRKGVKPKTRRLPISPMLKKFLPIIDLESIKKSTVGPLTRHIKDFLPSHHLHDLRHTFITRAQECGIKRELVSLWAGHAADSSITSNVYTHLEQNEAHQIAEMSLFFYDLV